MDLKDFYFKNIMKSRAKEFPPAGRRADKIHPHGYAR